MGPETERHANGLRRQDRYRNPKTMWSALVLVKGILPAALVAKCHTHLSLLNNIYSGFCFRYFFFPLRNRLGLIQFNPNQLKKTAQRSVKWLYSRKCMGKDVFPKKTDVNWKSYFITYNAFMNFQIIYIIKKELLDAYMGMQKRRRKKG